MVVIPPNPESQLSRPILQLTLIGAFWIQIFSTGMLVDLDPVLERVGLSRLNCNGLPRFSAPSTGNGLATITP